MMESTMSVLVGIWFVIMIGALGMLVVVACFWAIIELFFEIKNTIKENTESEEWSDT